jgi:hypothetical protein
MGFQDLAGDLHDRPLTDGTAVADLLDLALTEQDRRSGTLAVVVCDERARPRVVQLIHDVPPGMGTERRDHTMRSLAGILAEAVPQGRFLLARARPGGLSLTTDDLGWRRCVEESFHAHSLRLLGVHVVTPDGSREIPAGMGSAA